MCDPSFLLSPFWQGPSVFWWWWGSRIIRPCFGFGSFSTKCGVVVLMLGVDCGTKFTVVYVEFSFKWCWCLEHIRSILWESAITRRTFVKAARHNNALFFFFSLSPKGMRIPFSLFVRHTKERKEKRKHLCPRVRNISSEATTTSSKPPHIIFILSFSFFAGKMGRTKDVRLGPPTLTDRNWQGPRVRVKLGLSLSWHRVLAKLN